MLKNDVDHYKNEPPASVGKTAQQKRNEDEHNKIWNAAIDECLKHCDINAAEKIRSLKK